MSTSPGTFTSPLSPAAASVPAGIDILAVAKISPMLLPQLESVFHVHHLSALDETGLAAIAPRIRGIIGIGESRVDENLLSKLPNVKMISLISVGYDGIDVQAAKRRGIMVTHTPDVLNEDVADLAIALILNTARQLPQADRYVREGKWLSGPPPLARKVSGSRLGIVGMGRIGKAIAHRAAAFGMAIAYTARSQKSDVPCRYLPNPTALAAESDFLCIITPGGAATKHLINADVLKALGPKGILINVSRGSVVDQDALIDALQKGTIAGAGLDVFADEPRVPESLINMPHVMLTPHIGSATVATRQTMANLALENLFLHFSGKPVKTPVPECR